PLLTIYPHERRAAIECQLARPIVRCHVPARALAFVATQSKLQIYFPTDASRVTRGQCARSEGTMEGICAPVVVASACDSTIRCWHRRCGSIEAFSYLRLGRFDVAATLENDSLRNARGAGRFTGVPVTVSCEWEDLRMMEMNEYIFDITLRQRLAEIREAAERSHQVRDTTLVPHLPRVALGHMLIRIGRRLQGLQGHRIAS